MREKPGKMHGAFRKIAGNNRLTRNNLAKGFHQIVLKLESRYRASFCFKGEEYRWARVPCGLVVSKSDPYKSVRSTTFGGTKRIFKETR